MHDLIIALVGDAISSTQKAGCLFLCLQMADDESSMVGRQHGPHCTQSWSPVLHRYGPDKVQCGQQSSLSHKAGFLLCSQWQSIFHTPPLPLSYCQQYCCQHGLAHLQDTLLWLAPVCMCLCFLCFLFFANTDCGVSCVFTVFVFKYEVYASCR